LIKKATDKNKFETDMWYSF